MAYETLDSRLVMESAPIFWCNVLIGELCKHTEGGILVKIDQYTAIDPKSRLRYYFKEDSQVNLVVLV